MSAFKVQYADTEKDKATAYAFVRSIYEKIYNTYPPTADTYALVIRDDSPLACMGLELPHIDGSFQIERTWNIARDSLSLPLSEITGVQLGRWVSKNPKAGLIAVLATVTYGLRLGRRYALVEHDDRIHEHCKRSLGIDFWDIIHLKPNLEALPEHHRSYYAQSTMKPYLVDLKQMEESLSLRAKRFEIMGL